MKRKKNKYWTLYIFLIPTIIYIVVFCYVPMYGILMAFSNYMPKKGYLGSLIENGVGLKHFIRFIKYPGAWDMIKNTLSISLYSLATFPLGIILALAINELQNLRFKKVVQMVTYAPYFLSTVVMCGMIRMFCDKDGVIGLLYQFITGESVNLLTVPQYFNDIYVWSGVWQGIGWSTIIYIAALSGVPGELAEAAKIDGATRLQVIRHVNIPYISSTIVITFIMSAGGILGVGFDKILLLQNDLNASAATVISTYTYDIGIIGGQASYATAIGLFNNVINILMLLLVNKICKKISGVGIW